MNTFAAIAATQTDTVLETMLFTFGGRAVRDGLGNLREMTLDEVAFGQAIRAEAKARGLR